jgi:hypothetical protein
LLDGAADVGLGVAHRFEEADGVVHQLVLRPRPPPPTPPRHCWGFPPLLLSGNGVFLFFDVEQSGGMACLLSRGFAWAQ